MAEFPGLTLWTDAWIADTAHLSRAVRGLYHDLLVLCWRTPECRVPNDIDWIADRLKCTPEERPALQSIVTEFMTKRRNWLYQKRLSKEFEKARKRRTAASGNAKTRWQNENNHATALPKKKSSHAAGNASTSTSTSTAAAATPPPPVQNPTRDAMRIVEDTLKAIPGIDKHPVAVAPVIAPIWQLVQQGYDLDAVIVPRIKAVLMKLPPGKKISSWEYFARIIVDEQQAARPPPPAFETRTDAEWIKLLTWARAKKVWDPKSQGPFPNTAGCIVPAHLLQPDDGKGWIDFKDYRPERAA